MDRVLNFQTMGTCFSDGGDAQIGGEYAASTCSILSCYEATQRTESSFTVTEQMFVV
jgi:hypothetical protein